MNDNMDTESHRKNELYYNQMLKNRGTKRAHKERTNSVSPSFSSQKVEFSDYVFVIEGYEGIFYTLYFLTVPYITGAIFLFFFVAGGNYDNFKLMEMNAFLIIWLIGYEIVATIILIAIFISFLKYEKDLDKNSKHRNHY